MYPFNYGLKIVVCTFRVINHFRVIAVTSYWARWRIKSPASRLFTQPLFRRRSKKTSNLRVTGLCAGNSPVAGELSVQMASNAENVSIGWRHHVRVRDEKIEVLGFSAIYIRGLAAFADGIHLIQELHGYSVQLSIDSRMGLLPDTQNCGLRMCRECRERFPRHHGLAIPSCVSAHAWRTCRDASRDRLLVVSFKVGGGENVPGIPGAWATCNFTYLVRGQWWSKVSDFSYQQIHTPLAPFTNMV